MRRIHGFQKGVACLVAVAFCCLSLVATPVQATLVGTADIITAQENDATRQKVKLFLEREDVIKHLHALGVDQKEAQARVDTMTAEEIHLLAQNIDQMPAGGNALGFMVGVAFVAFVTLIITDIIGLTDIFTFIKKR